MNRGMSEDEWQPIHLFLRRHPGVCGTQATLRRFVEAVRFVLRTGVPWRDLPAEFGAWNSVWRRFARWQAKGIWSQLFDHVRAHGGGDQEWLSVDSSVVRAHRVASGARKKTGGPPPKPSGAAAAA